MLFIICSDSRMAPELLTQREFGKLLVTCNAGNIVPDYGPQPGGVSASAGYAVVVFRVGNIMVCGHPGCGTMGVIMSCACLGQLPAVVGWLHSAEAVRAMNSAYEHISETARLDALVQHNVIAQPANLRTHPCVARAPEQGRLSLHGWVYDIENGRIDTLDGTSRHLVSLAEYSEARTVGGTFEQVVA